MIPNVMNATSISVPSLNSTMKTVTTATGGMDRAKCTSGSINSETPADRPMAMPSGRPTTIAIPSAMPIRYRLGRMLPAPTVVSHRWLAGPENHQ